jgi:hypothetical protein
MMGKNIPSFLLGFYLKIFSFLFLLFYIFIFLLFKGHLGVDFKGL